MTAPPRPRASLSWFRRLGPGLITGAADDDPSGIATYSQAGAQFGVNMLWTVVLTYPLTAAIFWLKTRAGWKETVVNEVTHETPDSIKSLMQRIAESGRRVQDHGPVPIEASYRRGWTSEEGQRGDRAEERSTPPALAGTA